MNTASINSAAMISEGMDTGAPNVDVDRWPGLIDPPRARLRSAIGRPIIRRAAAGLPLRVEFPDGTSIGAGGAADPVMVINRPESFFARLAADAKIGFGEAYMVGDWDTGPGTDLADLLTPLASNVATLIPAPLQRFRRLIERRQPAGEQGTPSQARQNIHRHYDLSNDLFAVVSRRDAQLLLGNVRGGVVRGRRRSRRRERRKIDAILNLASVGPGCEMLEIGTGWGELAIRAAQRGAHVTTVTLSTEQRDLALRRVAAAGVSGRVRILVADYREVVGQYDAIVSVEMVEAVGRRFWRDYFATLDRLLRPGGRIGLQSITISHDRLLTTQDSYTWIHKYIFPGGLVPSIEAIDSTLQAHTSLTIAERRDFGPDYATTLKCWRDSFVENWPTIEGDRFDGVFKRMWEFYLAYCEAGFRARYLGVSQFALVRS